MAVWERPKMVKMWAGQLNDELKPAMKLCKDVSSSTEQRTKHTDINNVWTHSLILNYPKQMCVKGHFVSLPDTESKHFKSELSCIFFQGCMFTQSDETKGQSLM